MNAVAKLKAFYEDWKAERKERLRQQCLQYMVLGGSPLPATQHNLHRWEQKK